jgi:hypothetical protein
VCLQGATSIDVLKTFALLVVTVTVALLCPQDNVAELLGYAKKLVQTSELHVGDTHAVKADYDASAAIVKPLWARIAPPLTLAARTTGLALLATKKPTSDELVAALKLVAAIEKPLANPLILRPMWPVLALLYPHFHGTLAIVT